MIVYRFGGSAEGKSYDFNSDHSILQANLEIFSPATNLAKHQISFPGNWNFLMLALTGTTHGGIQYCGSSLEAEYLWYVGAGKK